VRAMGLQSINHGTRNLKNAVLSSKGLVLSLLLLLAAGFAPGANGGTACEDLTSLAIDNGSVTSSVLVPVGVANAGRGRGAVSETLPAYCRVAVTSKPVSDSEIHVEIWLPSKQLWNRKFEGTGNGGYSSAIEYPTMQNALLKGYAVAGCDTGHSGEDLKFAVGHPDKIDDWGWRAIHVMTEVSALVIHAYYSKFAEHSYFVGCSTGGHQALMEAQRFPQDYDGIVAGDPGNDRVHLNEGFLWSWLALNKDPESSLPASKLPVINRAVVAACDALDGIKDGIISDPRQCKFDPQALLCKGAETSECLTAKQVKGVRAIYAGAHNPRTGERIFSGWVRGSELGWGAYFVGPPEPARSDFWRYWVFGDPNWDPRSFDFDKDSAWAESKMAAIVADSPDLNAFRRHKGKLFMYEGWADPIQPPDGVIGYYENVEHTMGGEPGTQGFARLFMVPGMGHCGGGVGPNQFNALAALDTWVSHGVAPNKIIASHSTNGTVDRTRPLCPYPQVARWKGAGDTNDAANFVCVQPLH
jgi:feruloyl esterase